MSDFDKAVQDSQKLTSKPTNEQLLELYGIYNPASHNPSTPPPSPRPQGDKSGRLLLFGLTNKSYFNSTLQDRQGRGH